MQFAQGIIMRIWLAKLAEGCLEVVGLDRHIIVVRCRTCLYLIEIDIALGVCSAVIHVVAEQVASAAEFDNRQRICVFRINPRTAMICSDHAATKFAGKVGILLVAGSNLFFLVFYLLGSYSRRTP